MTLHKLAKRDWRPYWDEVLVALGRALLYNPRRVWHAAETLGVPLSYPHPNERAQSKVWPGVVPTHVL